MKRKAVFGFVAALLVMPAAASFGQGLKGEYFLGMALSGDPILTRVEEVNFDWGNNAPESPGNVVPADSFSIRWSGGVIPPSTGQYRFGTRTDDGIRVWVNGDLVINNWTDHGATWNRTGAIALEAGVTYAIVVEWYENGGGAICELYWSGPGMSERIIAADYLSPEQVLVVKARNPEPTDGATGVLAPLMSWEPGETAQWHDVYFGTSPDLGPENNVGRQLLPVTVYFHFLGIEPGVTYYWRIDEVERDAVTIHTGDVWSFTAATKQAFAPNPRDGDKFIDPNVTLMWKAGQGGISHEVYFGTDADAVANRDPSALQVKHPLPALYVGILEAETAYYWVVDEYDAANNKTEGDVWSFTTMGAGGGVKAEYFGGVNPGGEPCLEQIEDTIDHSWGQDEVACGLTDQVSARWTADLEIVVADTYTFITKSDDGVRVWLDGQIIIDNWTDHSATDDFSTAMYLEPGFYSLKMDYYENTSNALAQLYWQTPSVPRQIIPRGPLQPPLRAAVVIPSNGAVNTPQNVTLKWTAGDQATQHQVYFGDDADAVANATTASGGIYRGQQPLDAATFTPGPLEWNRTYYWRVDEVSAGGVLTGGVWRFTTADFIVVDDFETYTNEVGERPFEVWVDGIGFSLPAPGHPGNGTTAAVGHDIWDPGSPWYNGLIMEQIVVNSGRQSMPVDFNNVHAPYYAETERTFGTAQNWTVNGVDKLVIHFRGSVDNVAGQLYVIVEDTMGRRATVNHPDAAAITSAAWTEWVTPLSDISADGVSLSSVKKLIVGVGDRTPGNGAGTIYLDDIWVTKPAVGQ
jgi:hypothetical protein